MNKIKDSKKQEKQNTRLRDSAKKKLAKSTDTITEIAEKMPEELIHELWVHQIELETLNEELRRANLASETARDRYADLYDFAPVGYFTFTRDALISEANLTGASMLGVDRSKLIKKRFRKFVPSEYLNQWDRHFMEVLLYGKKQTCDLAIRRADDSVFYAQLDSIRVDSYGENTLVHCTVSDITERNLIEDFQSFLVQYDYIKAGESFFQSLARHLAEKLEADYVCIDVLEDSNLSARTLAVWFDGKFDDNVKYTLKDTPCGDVVGNTVCSFPSGVRHLFTKDAVLQEMKAEGYVGATLWGSEGKAIGLIALIWRQPLKNRQIAEAVLKLVAVRAAGELERKQAEEEKNKLESQLR